MCADTATGSRVDAAGPLAPAQGFFPTSTKLAVGGLSLAAATGCLRSARTLPGMEPAGGELGSSALGSPGPAPRMQPRPRPSNTAAAKTKPCLAQPSKLSLPAAVPADCGPVSYRIVSSRVWAARARRWDDAPPTAPAWTERGGGDKVWLFFPGRRSRSARFLVLSHAGPRAPVELELIQIMSTPRAWCGFLAQVSVWRA